MWADFENAASSVHNIQSNISATCIEFCIYSARPYQFRVSTSPDEIVFNREVAMDLLWLEQATVLHKFCIHSQFSNDMLVQSKSAKNIWLTFLYYWSTINVGHPNKIRSDREITVNSTQFQDLAFSKCFQLQLSPVEAHNAIETGGQSHAPLRRIYCVLRKLHHTLTPQLTLRFAVKRMNDLVWPEGLVPSFILFGVLLSLPVFNKPLNAEKQRMEAMVLAKAEMSTTTVEIMNKRALRSKLPPSTHYHTTTWNQRNQLKFIRKKNKTGVYR